jgi:hypothetical protein
MGSPFERRAYEWLIVDAKDTGLWWVPKQRARRTSEADDEIF